MTHTYSVSGMTCEGCEAKVKYLLGKVAGITHVSIDLAKGEAAINMTEHVSTQQLKEALKEYPKYQLASQVPQNHVVSAFAEEKKSWIATYKPLLIIAAFIAGVSAIVSIQEGQFHSTTFMNSFMAGFFLVFSFFKLLDIKGFASSYAMYDLLAMRVPSYGFIYPFIELILGISYLINYNLIITNAATIIVMGFSSLGVIKSVVDKKKIRCACLGAVFNLPMSTVTIIEDLLMVAMAAAMLIFSH